MTRLLAKVSFEPRAASPPVPDEWASLFVDHTATPRIPFAGNLKGLMWNTNAFFAGNKFKESSRQQQCKHMHTGMRIHTQHSAGST